MVTMVGSSGKASLNSVTVSGLSRGFSGPWFPLDVMMSMVTAGVSEVSCSPKIWS